MNTSTTETELRTAIVDLQKEISLFPKLDGIEQSIQSLPLKANALQPALARLAELRKEIEQEHQACARLFKSVADNTSMRVLQALNEEIAKTKMVFERVRAATGGVHDMLVAARANPSTT